MSFNDALWVKGVGTKPMAHLLRPNGGATRDRRAWCDAATDNNTEAPFLTRCGSCLLALRKFTMEAETPVPTRVLTKLTVEIEHGSDELPADVAKTAQRRLAPGRNARWRVAAKVSSSRALDPSETA